MRAPSLRATEDRAKSLDACIRSGCRHSSKLNWRLLVTKMCGSKCWDEYNMTHKRCVVTLWCSGCHSTQHRRAGKAPRSRDYTSNFSGREVLMFIQNGCLKQMIPNEGMAKTPGREGGVDICKQELCQPFEGSWLGPNLKRETTVIVPKMTEVSRSPQATEARMVPR